MNAIDKVKEALEFYAKTSKYVAPLTGGMGELWSDCGQKAKEALKALEEAEIEACGGGDIAQSMRDAAEKLEELQGIEDLLSEGQGDDDGSLILPEFDESSSTLGKVEACLALLERRRDVIDGRGEKRFIVWNEGRSEGFVTDDEQDAMQALSGGFFSPYSALGERFYELYGDDELSLEEIAIDASPEAG